MFAKETIREFIKLKFDLIMIGTFLLCSITSCLHQFQGPMTRNLKIHPDFSNHETARNAADVERLNISFVPSTHIFDGIGETFPKLKKLWIHFQKIKFIERENFADMTRLTALNLNNNEIEFVSENIFQDLSCLESLDLNNNQIRIFPENVFKSLKKLKRISFSNNRIMHLPEKLFLYTWKLEEIFAPNNFLKTINVDFTKLYKLKMLYLENSKCIDIKTENKKDIQSIQQIVRQNCIAPGSKKPIVNETKKFFCCLGCLLCYSKSFTSEFFCCCFFLAATLEKII